MVHFVIPYSTEKRLFEAYKREANRVQNENDWLCFVDGDTAFLTPDWGHVITAYTQKFPDTGLFTCYARCHYSYQRPPGLNMNETSIIYHREVAKTMAENFNGQTQEINRIIAGHLMVIQKKTWLQILPEIEKTTASKKMLGVDTKISHAIMHQGKKIRIMQSVYILHYLRMAEGILYTKHLQ